MGQREPDKTSRFGLREALEELRPPAGTGRRPSLNDIAYEARQFGAPPEFDGSWLSKVLSGKRPYDATLLAAIVRATGREPEELPHYRLAAARDQLDERTVGLEQALHHYEQIISALRYHAVQRSATARLQRERHRQAPPASLREALSEEAAG